MKKRKKTTVTQKNINKINANIRRLAEVFGTDSEPYQETVRRLHGTGLKIYDKKGVIQVKNTKENRRKNKTISKIVKERKSVNIYKRHYPTLDEISDYFDDGDIPFEEGGFYKWYSKIETEFNDLVEEVYTLADASEEVGITFGNDLMYLAFKDETFRHESWENVYNKLLFETKDFNKDFYEKFGFAVDPSTGEYMTYTNEDYQFKAGYENMFNSNGSGFDYFRNKVVDDGEIDE